MPGQKIAYVSDVAWPGLQSTSASTHLAADADVLFIEATFLERDADEARRKSHLTAKAGWLDRPGIPRA